MHSGRYIIWFCFVLINRINFQADIEDDFDANKHDSLMDEIFNEDFYVQNDPSFSEQDIERGKC